MITQKHVKEMKQRLKIFHTFEDEHIQSLLEQSCEDIRYRCQEFDMDKNKRGAELVYERTRYAYNDSLEFFHENFLGQITSFALENMKETDYEQEL
ncbi:phage gp6-like head-tail connector protein [Staphylococcus pseudintermedius]|uniref:phage gp6-like head-tail connector protein n=1 Tax=Staphylococcus pseudintermedius TaxID=283734 RepID=UPI0016552F9C|nr:phage gp6-like head-tail connector protein [Staphylococcus pseudintermedius]MBC8682214.1 phage gp6-like head-tail connector protein [Staphylococcus pseudintermedius]